MGPGAVSKSLRVKGSSACLLGARMQEDGIPEAVGSLLHLLSTHVAKLPEHPARGSHYPASLGDMFGDWVFDGHQNGEQGLGASGGGPTLEL